MKSMLMGLALLVATSAVFAQQAPIKSPRVTAQGENVEVAYGQPSKRGRVIFPDLEAYGKVWRTGANKSTDITFKKDATFGGKKVKAGTYSLFTIPGEKEWTVILNSVPDQPGAADYEKNKDKNVAEVKVPANNNAPEAEKLTISFPQGQMLIHWDKTQVAVPLTF